MAMLGKRAIQYIVSHFTNPKPPKDKSMHIDKVILVAISSAVGGALVGILYAPEKGKKTRKNLAQKRDEYLDELKKNTEELSQQLKNNRDSILEKSKKTAQNFKKDVEDYSEWTYQELYDHAKELKIKAYSQMNKSELIRALDDQ